jgi:4-hydroxybenzoate polyprenyltransferase
MRLQPTTLTHFYAYQKERFPLAILGISLLPAIFSSGAMVTGSASTLFIIISLLVSLAYLLHVRIIDEHRDFEHDLTHHQDRPLPRGTITLQELERIDWIAIATLIITTILLSPLAFLMATILLLYSQLAKKEFIIGPPLRHYFFTYNAVNLVQMLLLQILIYIIAKNTLTVTPVLLWHFSFTASGTLIFEFLRKVKLPGNDGTGRDTYTWFLGLNKALLIYGLLTIVNIITFTKIISLLGRPPYSQSVIIISLTTLVWLALGLHYFKRNEKTNQLMQYVFMLMYGGFNIIIFLNA